MNIDNPWFGKDLEGLVSQCKDDPRVKPVDHPICTIEVKPWQPEIIRTLPLKNSPDRVVRTIPWKLRYPIK